MHEHKTIKNQETQIKPREKTRRSTRMQVSKNTIANGKQRIITIVTNRSRYRQEKKQEQNKHRGNNKKTTQKQKKDRNT